MQGYAVTIVVALISVLMGASGGGFIVAWRRDNRQKPVDEAAADKAKLEITSLIEQMAERAVRKAKREMEDIESQARRHMSDQDEKHRIETAELRRRIEVQEARIKVLEYTLVANNITIPA